MNFSALLRHFSIRVRMIGAIAMVLTLLTLVGGVGLFGMSSLKSQTKDFADMSVNEANELTALVRGMGDLRRYEKDMLLNYEQTDAVKSYHQKWDETRGSIDKVIKEMLSGPEDADNAVLRKLQPLLQDYSDKAQPVIRQLEAGGYDNAAAANKLMAQAKVSAHAAEQLIDDLRKALRNESQAAMQQAEGTQSLVLSVFIAVLAVSALIVVPLTLLNMHSICKPLAEAEALAGAIAKGDLTTDNIKVEGKDEASHLLESLLHMQQGLQSLVGQLRTSADSIRTASVEIASGNQDLSGRTEQTASNLQQAASSMVQLTGTVKQTADSARTANQLATSASTAAAKGGEVVGHVVSTMDEINTSSKRIGDIIGVIDGIAFQTNILALNAAVEAARAGEQGRGFAVVAGEVRSLAQRSAEAAREIKSLISASVERVETGSRLVQDAGNSMNEIVSSVQRVTDIIGEITAAASEQSDGIGQVNQSVVQLDQMTQQNAALVEESAAAAESLKDQAERLSMAVDRFRIDAKTAHVVATPKPAPATVKLSPTPRAVAPAAAKPAVKPAIRPPIKPAAAKPAAAHDDGSWETF